MPVVVFHVAEIEGYCLGSVAEVEGVAVLEGVDFVDYVVGAAAAASCSAFWVTSALPIMDAIFSMRE